MPKKYSQKPRKGRKTSKWAQLDLWPNEVPKPAWWRSQHAKTAKLLYQGNDKLDQSRVVL